MEELINTKNGIAGLIASLVVIVALHLVWRVFEFIWGLLKKKQGATEKTLKDLVTAVELNTKELKEIKRDMGDLPKLRLDLRRSFRAIKFMSGDKWSKVRSAMMGNEDLPS